jgi:DNA-binding MarR family transcriptional regulator
MSSADAAERAWVHMSSLVLDNERRRKVAEALGMSFGRAKALRRIAARPMPMGELALLLGIDPPYMTLVVDDLEDRGLVLRRDHPDDRRAKLVVATEQGLAAAQLAERILDEPPTNLLALSSDELVTLEGILAKMVPSDVEGSNKGARTGERSAGSPDNPF